MTIISPLHPQAEAGASALGAPLATSLFAQVAATTLIRATLSSTSSVKLRRYQQEVLKALQRALQNGARAPVVVLPRVEVPSQGLTLGLCIAAMLGMVRGGHA